MRFALIDRAKKDFAVQRLCRVLGGSQSGYFAWRARLPSRRQRQDMVLLDHVRSAFALSNGTYGSLRMTRELRDRGLAAGRRRQAGSCGTMVCVPGRSVVSSARQTANMLGRLPPIFWTRISLPRRQTRNGRPTFPTSGPGEGGSTWQSRRTFSPGPLSAGLSATVCTAISPSALRQAFAIRLADRVHDPAGRRGCHRQLHRSFLQSRPQTFVAGLHQSCRLREAGHLITTDTLHSSEASPPNHCFTYR